MKNILFLDDDPERKHQFIAYSAAFPCRLTTVATVEECIAELQSNTFDLVLLDHDLGGQTYVDSSRTDTGMEVVRWLKRNGGDHKAFIVHTMNSSGAGQMHELLRMLNYQVEQAPFGSRRFFDAIERILGITQRSTSRPARRSFKEKFRDYLRSLRMK